MTTVLAAVTQVTDDARERLSLLMGALLEGGDLGAGPFPTGDSGTSFGPWQFHFTDLGGTHFGLTPQQAQDPAQAARAILPNYRAGVQRVTRESGDSIWQTSPGLAAARAAYYAESPAYMYPIARVQQAWTALTGTDLSGNAVQLVSAPGGPGANPPIPITPPIGGLGGPFIDLWDKLRGLGNLVGPGSGIADAAGSVGNGLVAPFKAIAENIDKLANPSTWWRVLFVLGGIGLVFVGIGILNKNAVAEMAGSFTGAAAKAV